LWGLSRSKLGQKPRIQWKPRRFARPTEGSPRADWRFRAAALGGPSFSRLSM